MTKKHNRSLRLTAVLLAAALPLTLCTACHSGSSSSAASDSASYAYDEPADYNGFVEGSADYSSLEEVDSDYAAAKSSDTSANASGDLTTASTGDYSQKLIRTYYYSFETLDFDASMSFITDKVTAYGGYMESSYTYGSDCRDSSLTIRIPSDRADAFISETGSIGEKTEESMSTEDVTLEYYDVTARLESLEAQRQRLLELMEKAENLADIASISSQLSDVEYDINSYTTRLRVYDNQIDYVTFHINLQEVEQISVVSEDSFFTRIQKGLSSNCSGLLYNLEDLLVWLITMLPYLIVWALVIFLLFLAVRRVLRRRAVKKAAKAAQQMPVMTPSEDKEDPQ